MAGWRPTAGDEIHGKIVNLSLSTPNKWGQYPILAIDTGSGVTEVHAFHSVLRNTLSSIRPVIGDTVHITYVGKVQGREYTYDQYEVRVDGKSADVWGAAGAAPVVPSQSSDIPSDDLPF